MRHRVRKNSSFGLKPAPKKALLRNLVSSLVEHERIKTTLPRAKKTRSLIERAITISRLNNLSSRKLLLSRYPQPQVVSKIMNQLSARFKNRAGGCTRIIKLGQREGDCAEMAYLEFVDYDPAQKLVKSETQKETVSKDKKTSPKKKKVQSSSIQSYKRSKKKRRRLRKIKSQSRKINRN